MNSKSKKVKGSKSIVTFAEQRAEETIYNDHNNMPTGKVVHRGLLALSVPGFPVVPFANHHALRVNGQWFLVADELESKSLDEEWQQLGKG